MLKIEEQGNMIAMSQIQVIGVMFAVLLMSCDILEVKGQGSNLDLFCRQCEARRRFYQQFVKSVINLQSMFRTCTDWCSAYQITSTTTETTTMESSRTTLTATSTPTFECGIQKVTNHTHRLRIVGGIMAAECEYPWLAYVSIRGSSVCAGAILTRRHILTAGHCLMNQRTYQLFRSDSVRVKVGSSSVSNAKEYSIANYTIHPQHDPVNMINDAAILTLAEDLTFSDCLATICLPKIGSDPKNADFCVVAGWGTTVANIKESTSHLQEVDVPIVDHNKCQSSYGQDRVNDRTLCAGDFYSGGKDSCKGDSGAPLMCRVQGQFQVYGIVSNGESCALPLLPGIYTRVNHPQILAFISAITGES